MSKTGDEALLISDEPSEIERKLKKAVTASEGQSSPGVDNLMQMMSFFAPEAEVKQFEKAIKDGSIRYSDLKMSLAGHINTEFRDFRDKKKQILAKPKQLEEILNEGAKKARVVASQTLADVKEKIGLL